MKQLLAISALAVGMWVAQAGAATLVYEGFDYPTDGPHPLAGIAGETGGTGFAGPWVVTSSINSSYSSISPRIGAMKCWAVNLNP